MNSTSPQAIAAASSSAPAGAVSKYGRCGAPPSRARATASPIPAAAVITAAPPSPAAGDLVKARLRSMTAPPARSSPARSRVVFPSLISSSVRSPTSSPYRSRQARG